MRRILIPISLICVVLACPAFAATALHRCPPGSYLRYRAPTVNELIYQVNRDAMVRDRYASHFGVGPRQLVEYFRTLRLTSLEKPTTVKSWYIDKNGKSRTKKLQLPKDTLVFVTPDGKPVLTWKCGNPLGDPTIRLANKPKPAAATEVANATPPATTEVAETPEKPIETKVLAEAPEIVAAPPDVIPMAEAVLPAPVEIAQLPTIVAPTIAPAVVVPVESVSRGLGALPYIGGIAGLVGGLVVAGGGDDEPQPLTIPEPSALAGLAIGLITLAATVRRRRPS